MEAENISPDSLTDTKIHRYERELILEIKKQCQDYSVELFESLFDVSTVSPLNGRSKVKQAALKGTVDRDRNTRVIVLGPQKRTWNTGCHVSYNVGRENGDSHSRSGKPNADNRMYDKQFTRHPSESKRDIRGSGCDGRERGRRSHVNASARFYRDDRYRETKRSSICEEEPEWFSEGPTTVNETIELGRLLDDGDDDPVKETVPFDRHALPPTPKRDSAFGGEAAVTSGSADKPEVTTAIPAATNVDSAVIEAQGSRFKHLFDSAGDTESKTKSLNDQLSRLLKGFANKDSPCLDKNNVIQVENKLRSILLGHSTSRNARDSVPKTDTPVVKSRILTVEEIESQLNSSGASTSSDAVTATPISDFQSDMTRNSLPSHNESTPSIPGNPKVTYGSNLAPILQSLALKQQSAASKTAQSLNTLTNLGVFPNPVVRTPPSTNALSASIRINQLQQSNLCAPPGLHNSAQQGVLRQLWDPNLVEVCTATPSTQQLNAIVSQRLLGTPGLLPDVHFKSGTGVSPQSPNQNTFMHPRRPIVKVQQNVTPPPNAVNFSLLNTSSFNVAPQRFGLNFQDVDHRLLNASARQLVQSQVALHGLSFPAASNENRLSAVDGQSFFDSFAPVSNNVNNPFFTQRTGNVAPKPENTLAFLSRLVDVDRSGVTLNHLKPHPSSTYVTSDVKAKTLEEIEHQEVSKAGALF